MGYIIYLDGTTQGNTIDSFWQYENLSYSQEYLARVRTVYEDGVSDIITNAFIFLGVNTSENVINPRQLSNYPNRFNPSTNIKYYLPETSSVDISIYNMKDGKIKNLINRIEPAWNNYTPWNGQAVNGNHCASGIFFCKLTNGTETKTNKMVLFK